MEGNDDDDATPFEAPMGDGHVTVVGSALDAYQVSQVFIKRSIGSSVYPSSLMISVS